MDSNKADWALEEDGEFRKPCHVNSNLINK